MNSNLPIRLAVFKDVPQIRLLVNQAYQELAAMGLNYTAVDQDEVKTWQRMQEGQCFVVESHGEMMATVILSEKNYFTGNDSAYISQLAIRPDLKRQGLGRQLMDFCEQKAQQSGKKFVQLDTAQPAQHLVQWYQRRDYKIVGETKWEGKTYSSFIFEKKL